MQTPIIGWNKHWGMIQFCFLNLRLKLGALIGNIWHFIAVIWTAPNFKLDL